MLSIRYHHILYKVLFINITIAWSRSNPLYPYASIASPPRSIHALHYTSTRCPLCNNKSELGCWFAHREYVFGFREYVFGFECMTPATHPAPPHFSPHYRAVYDHTLMTLLIPLIHTQPIHNPNHPNHTSPHPTSSHSNPTFPTPHANLNHPLFLSTLMWDKCTPS